MARKNRDSSDESWKPNRSQVEALLAQSPRIDNDAWLAEIEDDRRAEEGIDWDVQTTKPRG